MKGEQKPECENGHCQSDEGFHSICNCIHCGAELLALNGFWYHWTSFDLEGNLIDGAIIQDTVTYK